MQNKDMIEANLIVGTFVVAISTLLVGLTTLIVGILALRSARRSLGLAENRIEYLREEQDRLTFLREERQTLVEELKQERQERLEAQQKVDHLEWERRGFPEAQQEGPQMDRESAMGPPQEVSDASSTTGAAGEERPGGIRNTGTEGLGSEAHDDPDAEVTVDGEPAVAPKEVGRGTTGDRRPGATGGGAAQDEHETQQGPARRTQEDAENREGSVLARAMRHLRHR